MSGKSNKEYGVQWYEFDRSNHRTLKERFFKTGKARDSFARKKEEKDNFITFTSWIGSN